MDAETKALIISLALSLVLAAYRVIRAFLLWLELRIAAAAERSRRREVKRQRRESSGPKFLPTPEAAPESFDDEVTDMHELVELERETKKKRKSPGERAPRPGTHHDKDK